MARSYEEIDPAYTATCSDVTLCSNSKGFFQELGEEIVNVADKNGWIKKFENIEEGLKVATFMNNKEVSMHLFKRIITIKRDVSESLIVKFTMTWPAISGPVVHLLVW